MNEVEIFDNWLPEAYFKKIQKKIMGSDFSWNFNSISVYPSDLEYNDPKEYQFTHVVYANSRPICSETYDFLSEFTSSLGANILLKLKLNLNPNSSEIKEKAFHTDIPILNIKDINYKTGILYLNTNNGYTKFKSGEIVPSVQNRFIMFNGSTPHCGPDGGKRIGKHQAK